MAGWEEVCAFHLCDYPLCPSPVLGASLDQSFPSGHFPDPAGEGGPSPRLQHHCPPTCPGHWTSPHHAPTLPSPPTGSPPWCCGGIWPQCHISPHPPPPPWRAGPGRGPGGRKVNQAQTEKRGQELWGPQLFFSASMPSTFARFTFWKGPDHPLFSEVHGF